MGSLLALSEQPQRGETIGAFMGGVDWRVMWSHDYEYRTYGDLLDLYVQYCARQGEFRTWLSKMYKMRSSIRAYSYSSTLPTWCWRRLHYLAHPLGA